MTFEAITQTLPEWILLIGGCVVLLMGASPRSRFAPLISPITAGVLLLGLLATLIIGKPDPAYSLPGLMLGPLTYYVRIIGLGVGTLLVMVNWYQPEPEERGEYMAMILFSLLGLLLVPSANDLVVLFFAIELVSIPTYVLVALSRKDKRASEAAVKYFFLGAFSAAFLAYGFSLLYGVTGTTLIEPVGGSGGLFTAFESGAGSLALIGLLLAFGGLSFKIAAVPFHAYAPDVYEGAASPVTALLGFVPKLAGFVALIKLFAAGGWALPEPLMWVIWWVAALTMSFGNVLALLQSNVKRMLAYSSIAHTGYMLLALLVGPVAGGGPMRDGVVALLFYIGVYGVMNLGAFAALTAFRVGDRAVETLQDLGGIARRVPLAAFALAVCVFSLMGFPPTAGFLGKVYIFSSAFSLPDLHAFHTPLVVLAVIGVINSAIGAAYYLRIVATCYMERETEEIQPATGPAVRWGLVFSGLAMLVLFVWPSGLARSAREVTVIHRGAITAATDSAHMIRFNESPAIEYAASESHRTSRQDDKR